MSETIDQLITRELTAATEFLRVAASNKRSRAGQLLKEAVEMEDRATMQLVCDTNGRHLFETVKGSGMMGDRFEEVCKHCGWTHSC